MGLVLKNFEHNGLELKDVYLGVELVQCNSSVTNCIVHAYSSVDWRAKNKSPFASINKSYRFTKEDLSTVPLYKLIYTAIKNEYGDSKDVRDIEEVKTPVITSTSIINDNVVIEGTTSSEEDVIETVLHIKRDRKKFTITVPVTEYKEKYMNHNVYIQASQLNSTSSSAIGVFDRELISNLLDRPKEPVE